MLLTRPRGRLPHRVVSERSTQVPYAGMVGALVMTLAAPLWWGLADGRQVGNDMVGVCVHGLLGALGHLLLIRAYSSPRPQ